MERDDVQALLVLDAAWYAEVPAQFACQVRKPAFLAGRHVPRFPLTDQLLRPAAESGVTLMPDFGYCYTPATSRLRELVATRLGRPLAMTVDIAAPVDDSSDDTQPLAAASRDLLATTIDWCTNVVGAVRGHCATRVWRRLEFPVATTSRSKSRSNFDDQRQEVRRQSPRSGSMRRLIR